MAELQDQPSAPGAPGHIQCEVTGEWVPEDEVIELRGKRVGARGKQILLERLKAGEAMPGELERPGVLRRVGSAILDAIILGVAAVVISMAAVLPFAMSASPSAGVLAEMMGELIATVIGVVYFTLMHARTGQSVGKMAGKIKVVNLDGSPITMKQSFVRAMFFTGVNLISVAVAPILLVNQEVGVIIAITAGVAVAIYGLANALVMLFDRNMQRAIHDRIAGTRVVALDDA